MEAVTTPYPIKAILRVRPIINLTRPDHSRRKFEVKVRWEDDSTQWIPEEHLTGIDNHYYFVRLLHSEDQYHKTVFEEMTRAKDSEGTLKAELESEKKKVAALEEENKRLKEITANLHSRFNAATLAMQHLQQNHTTSRVFTGIDYGQALVTMANTNLGYARQVDPEDALKYVSFPGAAANFYDHLVGAWYKRRLNEIN